MPLTPGTRFGVYEVVAPIGAGGMGEVYRALDTRLGRDVALKVLPHAFANDRERLQRFEREAKTLALLNHPHIASVYGFEIADGAPAIAMELVDGQTVGERIASGALPLTETLRIARQIAEALDAAHERGIVHRDLKPANVKITSQGTVKVLDFGLAKTPDELAPDLSRSPTITGLHTREGVILGTAGYMSPEQARGQSIDKRSDVWAFGAPQAIATGQQPVWSAGSRSVIFSNGARGANYSLWEVPISNDTGVASGPARPITLSRGRDAQLAVSRDGRYVAFAGVAFSFNAEAMPFDAESGRASGPPTQLTHGLSVTYVQSFSPDGRSIAYESRLGTTTHLWRTDRAGAAMQLTADPAFDDSFPRWNPKGGNIAFSRRHAGNPGSGEIWLMAEDGGSPRRLVDKAGYFAWLGSGRGIVYFSRADNQLHLLTIADGATRRLTNEPGLVQVMACSADDQWLVYSSAARGNGDLRALPLGGGEPRTVAAGPENEYHPFISPSGQWLYYQRNHENFYRVPGPAQGFRPRGPEQVTHFPETGLLLDDPQWSVDGRQLLYSHGRMTSDIWLAALKQ